MYDGVMTAIRKRELVIFRLLFAFNDCHYWRRCCLQLSQDSSGSDDFSVSSKFGLRWFTPKTEVPLCGHATLASAAAIFFGEMPAHIYSTDYSTIPSAQTVP